MVDMQLKDFLESVQADATFITKAPVLYFCISDNEQMPIVFWSRLMQMLRSSGLMLESVDLSAKTADACIGLLQTSFLGASLVYWLHGLEQVDKKYKTTLLPFLARYTGPHTVIIFVPAADCPADTKSLMIQIPAHVTSALLLSLISFFTRKKNALLQKFAQTVVSKYDNISLDQACMIIAYMQVMGKSDATADIFEQILASEKSLFILSQYLFAKDAKNFYALLPNFTADYTLAFWTTFWSEHLWRAYHAHSFMEKNQVQQARAMATRLPFTFLQRDWKKSTLVELKNAHQFIYDLDVAFKNGNETETGLELFYSKFLLGHFA
jgi:hypothetical protein